MMAFKRLVRERDQFDNVYAEGKPAYMFPFRDCLLKTAQTQTNILELLAIDDILGVKLRELDYLPSEEEYVEEFFPS